MNNKMNTIKKIVLEAVKENKLIDFLQEKFTIPDLNKPIENIPTSYDWTKILPNTFNELFYEYPELKFDVKFHDAIINLIKGSSFDFKQGLSIFFSYIICEDLLFKINKNDIVTALNTNYNLHSFSVSENNEIQRIVSILKEHYNIKLSI